MSQTQGDVTMKLCKLMAMMERVPKRGTNPHFHYDYVTEADLVDAVRKPMAELGLALLMDVTSIDTSTPTAKGFTITTLHGTAHWVSTDGSELTMGFVGQGYDNQDKGAYKALTGATKYVLMKTLLISTGDDPETSGKPDEPASVTSDQLTVLHDLVNADQWNDKQRAWAKEKAGIVSTEVEAQKLIEVLTERLEKAT